jgi:predicted glycoside hydrolase/deacetylase ChbG (UPF0249 family)
MIHGSFHADSKDLEHLDVHQSMNMYSAVRPFIDLACGDFDFTLWLDPKDLTRIAGMLRSATEQVEAIIEANREKENRTNHRPLQLVPAVFPNEVARAA